MTSVNNDVPAVDYLLVGHITADLTPDGRQLGGTVSYAARTAHAFGKRVGVLTSAATDEPLLDELRQWVHVVSLPAASTTTFENIYQPEGRVQYVRGVAAPITPADIPVRWRATPLVHLGPIADEIAPEVSQCFPEASLLVTLQGWLRQWDETGRVRFKRWHESRVLAQAAFVVFSEEDISEAPDMEARIAQEARSLVVTRADKGGTYYLDGTPHPYNAQPAQVVNPTGAGDIFATSLFIAWQRLQHDVGCAAQVAASLAAHSVTRFGLESAPTPQEIQHALARVNSN